VTDRQPQAERAELLRRAATDRWGAGRATELGTAILRLASAIDAVQSFPLSDGIEPFPTGPEAPGE
jgi:hypothetical protein